MVWILPGLRWGNQKLVYLSFSRTCTETMTQTFEDHNHILKMADGLGLKGGKQDLVQMSSVTDMPYVQTDHQGGALPGSS